MFLLLFLTGCNLSNTPNGKVEELLGKYQSLDSSIIINPNILANDNDLDDDLEKQYSDIIKKQYQSMSYDIKDTMEDGDKAVVTVEVEVINYKKIINHMTGNISYNYHKRLIKNLKNSHDKVTYTIDFNLSKDNNGKWSVDALSNDQENKLLGIY